MTRNGRNEVQGSIKKTGTVKKCLRFGFHWGSMPYFKALGNTYSVLAKKPHREMC